MALICAGGERIREKRECEATVLGTDFIKTTQKVCWRERKFIFCIFASAMKYIWQILADSNFSALHNSPNFIILGCILVSVAYAGGMFTSKLSPQVHSRPQIKNNHMIIA